MLSTPAGFQGSVFDTHTTDPSRVWLPELVERIARAMPPNDAACTLRLVNKATAAQFRGRHTFTTVRLSQPVPAQAFAHKWAAEGAMRPLTVQQRRRLLCLTAASGSILNMEVALASVCLIRRQGHELLDAAAGAGRLEMYEWLLQQGYVPSENVVQAAAEKGQQEMCEFLLTQQPCCAFEVLGAARGGHPDLAEWLLQRLHQRCAREGTGPASPASSGTDVLHWFSQYARTQFWGFRCFATAAARSYDLPALQSMCRRCSEAIAVHRCPVTRIPLTADMLRSAAGSPGPDWQAKVEWLETMAPPRHRQDPCVCGSAAAASDAVSRLTWLRQRGYPFNEESFGGLLSRGDARSRVPVLEYLIAEGVYNLAHIRKTVLDFGVVHLLSAESRDQLNFGPGDAAIAVKAAARNGDLSLLQWAVEHLGASVPSGDPAVDADRMADVARTGNMEMLAWMHARGCPVDAATFTVTANRGCEEALEWLAERGCPMALGGYAYELAAQQGDLVTLRCLQRLGCPWGPAGVVFTACVRQRCLLPVLRWLAEAGCPVDWEAAVREATTDSDVPVDVRLWLAEQQERER